MKFIDRLFFVVAIIVALFLIYFISERSIVFILAMIELSCCIGIVCLMGWIIERLLSPNKKRSYDEKREEKIDFWLNVVICLTTGILTGVIASSVYVGDFKTVFNGIVIVLLIGVVTFTMKYLKCSDVVRKYFAILSASMGAGLVTSVVVSSIYAKDVRTTEIGFFVVIILIIFVIIYIAYINHKFSVK